ncbi:hypothetical protein RGQ21_68010 [Kitasatospora aureofaciens]|nr:hypothetical protein RGQ21_68010 [Kitasatospora aureofaciens]
MDLNSADRSALKVGDKIRILKDRLDKAAVSSGDILQVTRLSDGMENFEAFPWSFGRSDQGIGWEKVEEDQ